MHAIVEVRSGTLAGERVILAPGEELRVGSGARADLRIGGDRTLGELHFALTWDGERGALLCAETATGTLLDGQPVTRASWGHGAWIRAGRTDFFVVVEGALRVKRQRGPRRDAANVERAKGQLAAVARTGRLFGVLDAARDPRIVPLLRGAVDEHRCLYEGVSRETLADVAPYLVRFGAGSALLGDVLQEGFGRSWGVFLTSALGIRDVAAGLRGLVWVDTDASPGRALFRFYDPRVLRDVLPACDAGQLREIFRAAEAFLIEDRNGMLCVYTPAAPGGAPLGGASPAGPGAAPLP